MTEFARRWGNVILGGTRLLRPQRREHDDHVPTWDSSNRQPGSGLDFALSEERERLRKEGIEVPDPSPSRGSRPCALLSSRSQKETSCVSPTNHWPHTSVRTDSEGRKSSPSLQAHQPQWTVLSPILGWMLIGLSLATEHPWLTFALGAGLVACVLAAVHHAEVVAHRVGEPFGTLVLALAVTIIEVALIVSLMIAGAQGASALARDTIFAATMIILNGMVGLCLLVGGSRHGEQAFGLYGVNAALATLATIRAVNALCSSDLCVAHRQPAFPRAGCTKGHQLPPARPASR